MLRPLVPRKMATPAPHRLPESLLFPARSTEYLRPYDRKHCAPNHGKWLLSPAKTQNCPVWRVRSIPMPSVPLQQDCAHGEPDPLPKRARWLASSYHSAPSLVRWLPLWSLGKRPPLREPFWILLGSTNRRRPASGGLPYETEHFPSARSGPHVSRIVVQSQNRQNS